MKIAWSKPTVVLLHGWNLSRGHFLPLENEFHRLGYKTVSVDFPGFGSEPPPGSAWHVVDYAQFLKRFLEKRRISRPVLIGHSFGGRVALVYSRLFPSSITGLILTGTPGFSPVPKKKVLLFLIVAKVGRVFFSIPPLHLVSNLARRWLYYLSGAKDFFRAEGLMRQTFKYVVADDLTDAMEHVQVPCLLLWGELDLLVPVTIAQKMADVIPSSSLKVIPQADHGLPFKEPGLFASYADRFLKTL